VSIRAVVVDDQAMIRAGFGALLAAQPDVEVVGEAADGAQAVDVVRATRPDVVLMDVRMPVLDGLEATRRILADFPDEVEGEASGDGRGGAERPRILILTTFDVDDYVFEALRAGASGFLLKDATPQALLDAVRAVAAGDSLLAPGITRRLIEHFVSTRARPPAEPSRVGDLTPREREVFVLVARGFSNQEIAGRLFIAEQTTKTHVSRILTKLGLRDRVQAVVLGYETGLVTPGQDAGPG